MAPIGRGAGPEPKSINLNDKGEQGAKDAGKNDAHHLVNRSNRDAVYLEVGDRTAGDVVTYPDDDLEQRITADGRKRFHKDGTPY